MSPRLKLVVIWGSVLLTVAALAACAPPRPAPPKLQGVEETIDPAVWGETYPTEYRDWQRTKDVRPTGLSKYKRGGTGGREYDKLSEYPYMSAISSGFGFSVEYNEPRGHWWMLIDQNNIDPARLRAGGACLTCKTPYANQLRAQEGTSYFSLPYFDAVAKLPEKDRYLGVTCTNCHDNETLEVGPTLFTIPAGLKAIEMPDPMPKQQRRLLTCGQCHSTYVISKAGGKSVDVVYPWAEGTVGDISVEAIIAYIRGNEPASLEFTQTLTGFKLGYIRHPEYELFSRGSAHYRAGVACPDCHMPMKVEGERKVAEHAVSDPFDDPQLTACRRCHPTLSADQLRETVYGMQDRTVGLILTSGYSVAQAGRLFQILHSTPGSASVDTSSYAAAKDAYQEAFYRVAFIGAENSVGFHNPDEANRIAADALAWSQRSEGLLRQMLASLGATQAPEVDLRLLTFMEQRGSKRLVFDPALEFRDPSGNAERLFRENLSRLRSVGEGDSEPPEAPTEPLPPAEERSRANTSGPQGQVGTTTP